MSASIRPSADPSTVPPAAAIALSAFTVDPDGRATNHDLAPGRPVALGTSRGERRSGTPDPGIGSDGRERGREPRRRVGPWDHERQMQKTHSAACSRPRDTNGNERRHQSEGDSPRSHAIPPPTPRRRMPRPKCRPTIKRAKWRFALDNPRSGEKGHRQPVQPANRLARAASSGGEQRRPGCERAFADRLGEPEVDQRHPWVAERLVAGTAHGATPGDRAERFHGDRGQTSKGRA